MRQKNAINNNLITFASGCDTLVHDGQFTAVEYKNHVGWGHSSINAAIDKDFGNDRVNIRHQIPYYRLDVVNMLA